MLLPIFTVNMLFFICVVLQELIWVIVLNGLKIVPPVVTTLSGVHCIRWILGERDGDVEDGRSGSTEGTPFSRVVEGLHQAWPTTSASSPFGPEVDRFDGSHERACGGVPTWPLPISWTKLVGAVTESKMVVNQTVGDRHVRPSRTPVSFWPAQPLLVLCCWPKSCSPPKWGKSFSFLSLKLCHQLPSVRVPRVFLTRCCRLPTIFGHRAKILLKDLSIVTHRRTLQDFQTSHGPIRDENSILLVFPGCALANRNLVQKGTRS